VNQPGAVPRIRPATAEDLAALPALEAEADRLLEAGLGGRALPAQDPQGDLAPGQDHPPGREPLFILVAVLAGGRPPVGFVRVDELDGQAHLEQLSVHPDCAGRGLGRSLMQAALRDATSRGYNSMTLCTFADIPFNAPFYASCGFTELADPGDALAALRAHEARLGLDDLGRRTAMRIRL
jgi:ribosomal protein S18 acetylase RimI-like enzyme